MNSSTDEKLLKLKVEELDKRSRSDFWNISLLLGLYFLQGLPKGLAMAVSLMLQNRGVTYEDQAEFSLTVIPVTIKLLWAPIVDAIYSSKLGPHKSWIIPIQFIIALGLFFLSLTIDDWLGTEDGIKKPQVRLLTVTFFCLHFLAATQDIAVDGWALTLLKRKNVGHAGTCDFLGRRLGDLIGYVMFTLLNSKEFCNRFRTVPQSTGILSFPDFLLYWSVIYFFITLLIMIFKKDGLPNDKAGNEELSIPIFKSYRLLWEILKIKPLRWFCLILLTFKAGFGAAEYITPFKLIDAGVTRDKLVLITVPLIPLQAILPFVLKRYMIGARCMDCFIHSMIYRIFVCAASGLFVHFTPSMRLADGDFPGYYNYLLFLIGGMDEMGDFFMKIAFQGFSTRISDTNLAGTYITLLYTVGNLGSRWSQTLSLKYIENLTWRSCAPGDSRLNTSTNPEALCPISVDGYQVEIILGIIFSTLWLICGGRRKIRELQNEDEASWQIQSLKTDKTELALL